MNWSFKIRLSCILLVLLTGLGFHSKANNNPQANRFSQYQQHTQDQQFQSSDHIWINAPLPEKQEENLFYEDSEDEQHNWILLKSNQLFKLTLSALFGNQDDPEAAFCFNSSASTEPGNLSTIGRLSRLQIFRI